MLERFNGESQLVHEFWCNNTKHACDLHLQFFSLCDTVIYLSGRNPKARRSDRIHENRSHGDEQPTFATSSRKLFPSSDSTISTSGGSHPSSWDDPSTWNDPSNGDNAATNPPRRRSGRVPGSPDLTSLRQQWSMVVILLRKGLCVMVKFSQFFRLIARAVV